MLSGFDDGRYEAALVRTYSSPIREWRVETEESLAPLGYRGMAKPSSATSSALIKTFESPDGVAKFWDAAHNEGLFDLRPVELRGFWLTEWVPISPGLYFEPDSEYYRQKYASEISISERLGRHYVPQLKFTMRRCGFGCRRLGAIQVANESPFFILSATTSNLSDQGIPVRLNQRDYWQVADEIRENGAVRANLGGRVTFIPEAIPEAWPTGRPAYGVNVEALEIESGPRNESMVASAFITFTTSQDLDRRSQSGQSHTTVLTSYSRFRPGSRVGSLKNSIRWLNEYVAEYGDKTSRILSDFDVYAAHFDNVEQPLIDIMAGKPNLQALEDIAQRTRSPIYINTLVVNQDHFSGISNSSIINRSKGDISVYEIAVAHE